MVKACDEAGVRLFVVKQNRRNRTLQLLQAVAAGAASAASTCVTVNVFWTRPQSYYDTTPPGAAPGSSTAAPSRTRPATTSTCSTGCRPGGQRDGLHRHAGAQHRGRGHRRGGAEAGATARWARSTSPCSPPKNFEGSITIPRRDGTVRIGGVAVNRSSTGVRHAARDGRQLDEASYQTTSVYGFGHPLYYDNVIRTLRGERSRDRWPRGPEERWSC